MMCILLCGKDDCPRMMVRDMDRLGVVEGLTLSQISVKRSKRVKNYLMKGWQKNLIGFHLRQVMVTWRLPDSNF